MNSQGAPRRVNPETELTLRVDAMHRCAADVVSLELVAPDGSELPGWAPGAHVDLVMAGGLVRQYSLCGDPARADRWRIAVLREPEGRGGSRFVHERIGLGDEVVVRGPRNNFGVVEAERYIFIAGGIGITPILPMVREVAAHGAQWTLLYGGRTHASMAFTEELRAFPGGTLRLEPQDEYGLLDLDSVLAEPDPAAAVYCCGPGPLIDAVEQRCARWPSGALHRERFTARELPPARPDGAFEVELARSGVRLPVPADQPLLDVLEEAGYAITNSCRAGICGTCLTGVVDGVPEHLDDVLSDEERDSGEVILPCVSRSKTEVLVLDL